jgi:hypothetical protein
LLATLLLGCTGTEIGNPGKTSIALGLSAYSSDVKIAAGGADTGVRVESAELQLVSLVANGCREAGSEAVPEPLDLDLLDPSTPPLTIPVPGAALCDVALDISSIVVSGFRADDAPFVVSSLATLSVALTATTAVDVSDGEGLLVGFDLGIWLAATDLSAVPLDTDGVARLDGAQHPVALATFEAQIAPGTNLYRDLDGNHVIDVHEAAEPLANH